MKTIGLKKLENVSVDSFVKHSQIKLRKGIYPFTKVVINLATKLISNRSIVVDRRPELDDDNYIFASTHYYTEDIEALLGSLDRNAWALMGTTDQIENNPKMYGAWLNGMIYVDRNDNNSRKESLLKMQHILNNNASIAIFVEGGWNNKENMLCMNPFSGAYYLATKCDKKVVPVSSVRSEIDNKIHVLYGDPIDLSLYKANDTDSEKVKLAKKLVANSIIRDALSSLKYELLDKYTKKVKRASLNDDAREEYLDVRLREYMKSYWSSKECIQDELVEYKPKYTLDIEKTKQTLKELRQYETSIHKELDECDIEQFEKDNLFKLLKFMDPDEAFRIIGIIKEKKYVNYDYLNKAKKNNVEYLAQSIELKPIVTEHEVMTFLRNVNINSDNASSLISSKIRYDEEEEEKERYSLRNYIENNYELIKLEKKKIKKKSNK